MSSRSKKRQIDLEWERRVLCGDEACIGTIGLNGECKECGRPYEGKLPDNFYQTMSEELPASPSHETPSAASPPPDLTAEIHSDDDDEWERRTLCSDESCIGVIGPDGRCKECELPLP